MSSRPDHVWNDPDDDGHNCVDCGPTSIWKCDRAAHLGGVLSPLAEVEGMKFSHPDELLTTEERRQLYADLERLARQRRTAGGNLG